MQVGAVIKEIADSVFKEIKNKIMKDKTLLVIAPSKGINCPFNIFVAETGEHLASHFCSHEGYAYGDLYATREERKEEWTKRFGKLDVKFINETGITEEQLQIRNKNWFDNLPKDE